MTFVNTVLFGIAAILLIELFFTWNDHRNGPPGGAA